MFNLSRKVPSTRNLFIFNELVMCLFTANLNLQMSSHTTYHRPELKMQISKHKHSILLSILLQKGVGRDRIKTFLCKQSRGMPTKHFVTPSESKYSPVLGFIFNDLSRHFIKSRDLVSRRQNRRIIGIYMQAHRRQSVENKLYISTLTRYVALIKLTWQ